MFCKDNDKVAVLLCFASTFYLLTATLVPKSRFCPFLWLVACSLSFFLHTITHNRKETPQTA